jgi:uncharacterized repeat protein (TIGR03806 family)
MIYVWIVLALLARAATMPVQAESARVALEPFLNHAMPEAAPKSPWSAVVAFPKLLFTNAVGLAPVPGTPDLLCVWEREGRAWAFTNSAETATKRLMLDVIAHCQGWDDSGLLGVAFHPGYATNHFIFVFYLWVPAGKAVGSPESRPPPALPNRHRLSRFTIDAQGIAKPESELVLIDQNAPSLWHAGGALWFGPKDGFLYLGIGDNNDRANTQRINMDLFSGILRLDVDQQGGNTSHPISRQPKHGITANYFIPNGNPFVGQAGVLEEFYALGLRNPYRASCDPQTGRTFVTDVGEQLREEINLIEPTEPGGLNFQWPLIEGLQGELTPPYLGVSKRPWFDYNHAVGQAVIGGYVYRGEKFKAELGGKYIFGDNVQGLVWALDPQAKTPVKQFLCSITNGTGPSPGPNYIGLSSFGLDQDNELYLCQMSSVGGHIYTLAHQPDLRPAQQFPPLISQTGVFADLKNGLPVTGLIPYEVNSPLWSDGAVKERWLALPAGKVIDFSAKGEWHFPVGTVFVKTFSLPIDDRDRSKLRRLETRFLVCDTNRAAYGVTYKWRPDNREADLLTNAMTEIIEIAGKAPGARRKQAWYYPSSDDCLTCHTRAANFVLGVKTRQINREFVSGQTRKSENQISAWSRLGLFQKQLKESELQTFDRLVPITETGAPLQDRVRSYLDSNCSHCHRPGGSPVMWDARFDTPLSEQRIINGRAYFHMEVADAKVVVPNDLSRSILYQRLNTTDAKKMPPLARNTIDEQAVATVAEWIAGLTAPSDGKPPASDKR